MKLLRVRLLKLSPKTFNMVPGLEIIRANHCLEINVQTNNSNFPTNKSTDMAVESFPGPKA